MKTHKLILIARRLIVPAMAVYFLICGIGSARNHKIEMNYLNARREWNHRAIELQIRELEIMFQPNNLAAVRERLAQVER